MSRGLMFTAKRIAGPEWRLIAIVGGFCILGIGTFVAMRSGFLASLLALAGFGETAHERRTLSRKENKPRKEVHLTDRKAPKRRAFKNKRLYRGNCEKHGPCRVQSPTIPPTIST